MMRSWLGALAVLLAINATASLKTQRPDVTLWVTLGDSDQLVEVDAYKFTEIRRITTDPRPHGLAASADGSKIYIGSDRTGNFQVIDARSGKVTAQIPLGKDPNQMTLTRDGEVLFVSLWDLHAVAAIDIATRKVLANIQFERGTGPKRILVAPKVC